MGRKATRGNKGLSMHPTNFNGETPFSLTYDIGTMILVEVGKPTLRKRQGDFNLNDECLKMSWTW